MSRLRGSVVVAWVAFLVFGLARGQLARASGMNDPWSGASASASYFNQSDSQQGATASASASGSQTIDYPGRYSSGIFHVTVSGSVSASAGDSATQLLHVSASDYSPNPGSVGGPTPQDNGAATASWTNDSVLVKATPGSSLPDTIRLNFGLTFTNPGYDASFSMLTATFNGSKLAFLNNLPGAPYLSDGHADSTTVTGDSSSRTLGVTFHVDLPVDSSGRSDPFSLGLQLKPFLGLFNDAAISYSNLNGNISLLGVTLPDGTSLASHGDSVSFASGLPAPANIPEPASLIAWSLVVPIVVCRLRFARKGR